MCLVYKKVVQSGAKWSQSLGVVGVQCFVHQLYLVPILHTCLTLPTTTLINAVNWEQLEANNKIKLLVSSSSNSMLKTVAITHPASRLRWFDTSAPAHSDLYRLIATKPLMSTRTVGSIDVVVRRVKPLKDTTLPEN